MDLRDIQVIHIVILAYGFNWGRDTDEPNITPRCLAGVAEWWTALNEMESTRRRSKFDGKYVRLSLGHVEFKASDSPVQISCKQ